jgi:hypothetical protein
LSTIFVTSLRFSRGELNDLEGVLEPFRAQRRWSARDTDWKYPGIEARLYGRDAALIIDYLAEVYPRG